MEVLRASHRLREREVPHEVVYLLEPAKLKELAPRTAAWVVVTHTRPHVIHGLLSPLSGNVALTVLGYRNEGGTLDTPGMLMVNGCTWAHAVQAAGRLAGVTQNQLLSGEELAPWLSQTSPNC